MEMKVLNVELKVDPPLQTGHNGMGHMCDVKCAQWEKYLNPDPEVEQQEVNIGALAEYAI